MGNLSAQPIAIGQAKKPTQSQIGVSRDGALTCNDLSNALRRNANLFGQTILAKPHRLKELFQENFARRNWFEFAHDEFTSVVVHDFHIFGARIRPPKADAPLIIDTNAVRAGTVALERFKTIAGRHSQILQSAGDLELSQLAPRNSSDVHEPPDAESFRERFGIRALE
jgi:hypothetical protein